MAGAVEANGEAPSAYGGSLRASTSGWASSGCPSGLQAKPRAPQLRLT